MTKLHTVDQRRARQMRIYIQDKSKKDKEQSQKENTHRYTSKQKIYGQFVDHLYHS